MKQRWLTVLWLTACLRREDGRDAARDRGRHLRRIAGL
jgi:hypothetical protein